MNKNNLKLTDFEFKNDTNNSFLSAVLQSAMINFCHGSNNFSQLGKRGTSEINIWVNDKPNEDFMDSQWVISLYGETDECMVAARFVPTLYKKYFHKDKDSNKWIVEVDNIADYIKDNFADRWL